MSDSGLRWFVSVPPIIHAPVFVFLFWWLTAALGRRVLRILGTPMASFDWIERAFLALSLGTGFLQYLPWTLGQLHVLSPTVLRWTVLALTLCLVPDAIAVARSAWQALQRPRARVPNAVIVWSLMLAAALALLLTRALVFESLGDDDGYHLSAPKRWLEAHSLIYLPTYTHTNAAMGFEMLYTIGLAVWDPIGAKLLHFCAGLFALLGVGLVGRRLDSKFAGALAVSALMISTPFASLSSLLPLAFVDMGACWMTIASMLVWLSWRESQDRRLLIGMALCAGFTGSFKFTALTVSAAWVLIVAVECQRRKVAWRSVFGTLLTFGVVAFAPVLPWLVRNWQETGNPVYPMLSSVIPSRDWTAEQARVFGLYIHYYAWGIASSMSLARRKLILAIAAVVVVAATALGIRVTRSFPQKLLLALAAALALISLQLTGLYFRYFLPSVICVYLVLGALIAQRWTSPRRRWLACAVMGLALLQLVRNVPDVAKNASVAAGLTPLQASRDDAFWQTWQYIDEHTPPDARVLVAAFYTTFGSSSFGGFPVNRRCYVTDSHLQTFIDLQRWDSFLRSLKSADISTVVISERQFSPNRHGFEFTGERNEYAFSRRLVDQYGEKLAQFGDLQVYRVHVERAAAAL